jgi:hypothetical protein
VRTDSGGRFREHICKPPKIPQQRTVSLCSDEQQARLQILCNWILGSLGLIASQLVSMTIAKQNSSAQESEQLLVQEKFQSL